MGSKATSEIVCSEYEAIRQDVRHEAKADKKGSENNASTETPERGGQLIQDTTSKRESRDSSDKQRIMETWIHPFKS